MRNGSHYHMSHKNFIGFIPISNNKELTLNFTLNVEKSTEYRIKQIEIAEANYYRSLVKTLDKIENRLYEINTTKKKR